MPNWCCTTYRVFGDKEQRDKLFNILNELKDLPEPRVKNGFGHLWLGCVIDYLGGDWNDIYCRGDIVAYYDEGDYLQIETETAWREMHEFRHFLEKKLPGIRIYYIADEPGMAEYYTNDKDYSIFHTRFYVDFEDYDSEYFDTIEEVADWMNRMEGFNFHVEPTIESICEAFQKYEEEHEDHYAAIHEYEYYDVTEEEEENA